MGSRFFDHLFKPLLIFGVVICIFFSCFAKESMAMGNIHIESLKIMPSIVVAREYTDNYFPRDFTIVVDQNGNEKLVKLKKSASVIKLQPSLQLYLPFSQNDFMLSYRMQSLRFQNQDLQKFDSDSHYITSKLNWHFFPNLTTEITDNLSYAESIPDHINTIMYNWYGNRVSVLTSYELGRRYKSELEVTRSYTRYKQDQWKPDNDDDLTIRSSVLYQIMPKTFVGVEYTHERYNRKDVPGEDSDYNSQNYWFVISFDDPEGRLNGKLRGGTTKIKYDDKTLNTGNNFFGFMGDLTFKKSKYTTITFTGMRAQANTSLHTEDAFYGSSFKNTTLTLGLTHKFSYKISGTLSFSYNELQFNSQGASGTIGGIIQQLNLNRQDTAKTWSGGLDYQMRDWLGFKVLYSYVDHKSNFPNEAFKKNQFITEISLRF